MNTDLKACILASSRARFGSGASAADIAEAEALLGSPFPPSYRAWLEEFGAGYLGGYPLNGVAPREVREIDEVVSGDVVWEANQCWRDGGAPSLVPLLSYEGDETYFLDLSTIDAAGEAAVVVLRAGESAPSHYAASFAEFLLLQL